MDRTSDQNGDISVCICKSNGIFEVKLIQGTETPPPPLCSDIYSLFCMEITQIYVFSPLYSQSDTVSGVIYPIIAHRPTYIKPAMLAPKEIKN